jgi:alkylhydroperoxidase/carboxymuconolactone decarboxylase family protein YurZ
MTQRRTLIMRTPADPEANQAIVALDPDFGVIATEVGTETWNLPGLTPQDCAFLCLTADVCNHLFGLPFQLHVEMVLANGGTLQQVKEVLLHLAPHVGYALILQALMRLKEIYPTFNQDEQTLIQPEAFAIFDEPTREELSALDASFGDFAMRHTLQVWQRGGLTTWERAYLALAVDVQYQTLGAPFQFHVKQAVQSGATREQIKAVLRFLAEFSIPKTWQAFQVLNPLLDEGD